MPPSTPDQSGLRALWKPEQGMTPCNPSGGDVAIFHASVKTFSRGRGQSAVAAAAYRAGVQLHDELGGKTQDYRSRSGVLASFIVLPNNAPSWMADRAMLWNMAEWREKRKDSVLARELEVALPHELTPAARERLVRNMAEWLIDRYGVAVDAAIHTPDRAGDDRNHHAHIMFTTRAVIPEGFGDKTRILDTKKTGSAEVQDIRQAWQDLANAELAAAGARARIDRRSHAEKGLDVPPQIHVGVNAVGMARRGVEPSGSNVIAYKGREVDYAPIDMGGTRAQHNADIIELQKYREPETTAEQVARITAKINDLSISIEELGAALDSGILSDDMRVRIRMAYEKAVAAMFYKNQQETEWLQARHRAEQTAKELEQKQIQRANLIQLQEQLQQQLKKEEETRAANQKLFTDIMGMWRSLNGLPPYVIKLEIPISAQFNEASYQGVLRKQSTAQLLETVLSPPTLPSKPIMATVTLRQDVLAVKELLGRAKLPPVQGRGRMTAAASFKKSMRK